MSVGMVMVEQLKKLLWTRLRMVILGICRRMNQIGVVLQYKPRGMEERGKMQG